jgi:hypothetical protein
MVNLMVGTKTSVDKISSPSIAFTKALNVKED